MVNNFIKIKKIIVMVILVVMITGIVTPVFAADNLADQITGIMLNPSALGSFMNAIFSIFEKILSVFGLFSGGEPETPEQPEQPVQNIKISGSTQVTVGSTITLKAENATGTVTWRSSDTSKATVDNGVVKGVKAGDVTIKALAGGKEASHTVKVVDKKNMDVEVSEYSIIKTNANGALPAISRTELDYVLKNRTGVYTTARKNNMDVDEIINIQDTYKVNALYTLAVGTWESGWGTDGYGESRKNIFSIKNSSGKYKTYSSYTDSITNFGTLLAGDTYFKAGNTSIVRASSIFKDGSLKTDYNSCNTDLKKYIKNIKGQMQRDYDCINSGYQNGKL